MLIPKYRIICVLAIVLMIGTASGQQQAPAPERPVPAALKNYRTVTTERLKNPDARDWLMVRRTYDGWGYSPLAQITPANVNRLKPVWVFSTAEARVHQAAPLVNDGVMFVTSPNNQVIAIDAKSGQSAVAISTPARARDAGAASDQSRCRALW